MGTRNQPTLFIQRLWNILNKGQNDSISWNQDGSSFLIKDQHSFQEQILATNFNHSNYSSFIRQLNMYSFKKIRKNKVYQQFCHQLFRKNHKQLLSGIKRKASQQDILRGKKLLQKAGLIYGFQQIQNSESNEVVQKKIDSQIKYKQTISPICLIPVQSSCSNSQFGRQWDDPKIKLFFPDSKDSATQTQPNNYSFYPNPIYNQSQFFTPKAPLIISGISHNSSLLPVQNYSPMLIPMSIYSHPMGIIHPQTTIIPSNSFNYPQSY